MNWAESFYIRSGLRTKRLREGVVPRLIDLGGRTDGLKILDVGCGPGECVASEIETFGADTVTAVDLDPLMVDRARRRLRAYGDRVVITAGDVSSLPYEDGEFEAVFNFAVLHHVPDWRQGLREIARVLVAGGRLFSQDHDVANHDWLSRHLFAHPPDRFSNADFLEELNHLDMNAIGVDDQPGQLLVVASKR